MLGKSGQESHPERPPPVGIGLRIGRAPIRNITRHQLHKRGAMSPERGKGAAGPKQGLGAMLPSGARDIAVANGRIIADKSRLNPLRNRKEGEKNHYKTGSYPEHLNMIAVFTGQINGPLNVENFPAVFGSALFWPKIQSIIEVQFIGDPMSIAVKSGLNFVDAIKSRLAKNKFADRAQLLRFGLPQAARRHDVSELAQHIILPCLPVTDEEMARTRHRDRGQKMARQEMWQELSDMIEYADDARLATPGGDNAALLLATGARGDIVAAAEDALCDGSTPDPEGIEALEAVLTEHPGNAVCAMIVAMTYIDIGWIWRNLATGKTQQERELRYRANIRRAGDLLAPFDPVDLDSPSLAAALCALTEAQPVQETSVTEAYTQLIELDPDCPRHMRSYGRSLLPDRFGSHEQLEVQARRIAALTADVWGAGAYAWMYMDALALDAKALVLLDSDLFIAGLRDILSRRRDQHVVNQLAAFCAITMAPPADKDKLPAGAEEKRARLYRCVDWIITDHLQELHPLIWAQALLTPGLTAPLPRRQALVAKGREIALQTIAERFADDIAGGASLVFSTDGMNRIPGR